MSIIKTPYELSLWKESYNSLTKTYSEIKDVIFGSSEMDFEGKAFNVILKKNINGTAEFSFNLPTKYFDKATNSFIDNYLVDRIQNESIVKVFYDEIWYDFIVKDIVENETQESIIYEYSCKDLFINELSKSGFEISFSGEDNLSIGTIDDLSKIVLDGSDWEYEDITDPLYESVNEYLYPVHTKNIFTVTSIVGNNEVTFQSGTDVYLFYSDLEASLVNNATVQIFYHPVDGLEIENDYFLANLDSNFEVSVNNLTIGTPTISQYSAKKLILNKKTEYNTDFDRVVTLYKKNGVAGYYGYDETEIITSELCQNLLTNSSDFVNNDCWSSTNSSFSPVSWGNSLFTLKVNGVATVPPTTLHPPFFNTGLLDRGLNISINSKYILKIKYFWENKAVLGTKIITNGPALTLNAYIGEKSIVDNSVTKVSNEIVSLPLYDDSLYYVFTPTANIERPCLVLDPSAYSVGAVNYNLHLQSVELFEAKSINEDFDLAGITSIAAPYTDLITPQSVVTATPKVITRYYIKGETIEQKDEGTFTVEKETSPIKRRSLKIEKSNRFNILQNIAELFDCWASFSIAHKTNGQIDTTNGTSGKTVKFVSSIGQEKKVGFVYGINLVDIKRTINSDEITTKMFVEDNDSDFAKDGICSIKKASFNPSLESFLLNFDYYIQKGNIEPISYLEDVYGPIGAGKIAYFNNLKTYNQNYDSLSLIKSGLQDTIDALESRQTMYTNAIQALTSTIADLTAENLITSITPERRANNTTNIVIKSAEKVSYEAELVVINTQLGDSVLRDTGYYSQIDPIEVSLSDINLAKKALHETFYRKYSRYIQEGSWSDSIYNDDNLYYLDAQTTLQRSSKPQISYEINVIDVAPLEGYEDFSFQIGDITFIEDTEFFGYTPEGVPYRESVIISELEYNLDKASENKITIQNFNTQFEDLFQRVNASVQSAEFNKNTFLRAKNFTPTKEIENGTLQNSLLNNNLVLMRAVDQTLVIDTTGITLSAAINLRNKVRIFSEGIFLTKDGGDTWQTGITADGINTELLAAGQIDASKINIMSGNYPSFAWNSTGINAYKNTSGVINPDTFIRMDQYGIYSFSGGTAGDGAAFDAALEAASNKITYIKSLLVGNEINFCLLNDGTLSLTGQVTATSGAIGGFTLLDNNLYTGSKTAYNDGLAGVHVGENGIGLGANFRVSSAGVLYSISGTIGGFNITASSLYTNTQSSILANGSGLYLGNNGLSFGLGTGSYCAITAETYGPGLFLMKSGKTVLLGCSYNQYYNAVVDIAGVNITEGVIDCLTITPSNVTASATVEAQQYTRKGVAVSVVRSGIINLNSNGVIVSENITFSGFSSTPHIVVTTGTGAPDICSVSAIANSSTGATIYFHRDQNQNTSIYWIAVGPG